MKSKGGISTLVATVLLILLVIIMIFIIWRFLGPLISSSTELSKICSEARVRIDINSGQSCYSVQKEYTSTMIVQETPNTLTGLKIGLSAGGEKRTSLVKEDPKLIFLAEFDEGKGSETFEAISETSLPISNPFWTVGRLGNAIKYTGNTFVNSSLQNIQEITIEMWVKPE